MLPSDLEEKLFQSYKNDSKNGELKEFYELLSDFKNYKPITIKIINRKNRILNNVNQLYNKYLDTYKKKYDSEDLDERDENFLTLTNLKYLIRKNTNQSGLKKILTEMQKPLWFKINKKKKLRINRR